MRRFFKGIVQILKKSEGVSLIEVLATVTILGVIAVPFTSVFMQSLKLSNESTVKSSASQTAVKYMEKYKVDDSIPLQVKISGEKWVPISTVIPDDGSSTQFKVTAIVEVVDSTDVEKYSFESSNQRVTDPIYGEMCSPQAVFKITVNVYLKTDTINPLVSVTGMKRGIP